MSPTVLIIEDEPDVREALRDAVSFIGRTVHVAHDGQQALTVLKSFLRPCLILLDLVMPVMDGWRFLEALRADSALCNIPVVVVSAHAGTHAPTGANGLLRKPIELRDLRQAVLRHCPDA